MSKDGSATKTNPKPLWLLAELTYACPLQCPYCSNPLDFALRQSELTTEDWLNVFTQARQLGATQLGFSGGEPLVRSDLITLVTEARRLGFYTNLITSGMGLKEPRLAALKEAGLDNIQLSVQASSPELNDYLAGTSSFTHKMEIARLVKQYDYPLVLNVVLHRHNIDHIRQILEMALALKANYVELANTQYYSFALHNRNHLLPTKAQVEEAERVAHDYQTRYREQATIYYVVPDYYETRPKACMGGWGSVFLAVTPDGLVLPCHAARVIPDLVFPHVKEASLRWIWEESPLFNQFRGFDWMPEPCQSCPHKLKDFGGCRCQAFLLTGDAAATDPVCEFSPRHATIHEAIAQAAQPPEHPLVFRNPKNSRRLTPSDHR